MTDTKEQDKTKLLVASIVGSDLLVGVLARAMGGMGAPLTVVNPDKPRPEPEPSRRSNRTSPDKPPFNKSREKARNLKSMPPTPSPEER